MSAEGSRASERRLWTGRCLCGEVRYEVTGRLPPFVNCHCQYCRRVHGSAFVTIAWVLSERFSITAGEDDLARYHRAGAYRAFCRRCSTPLFNALDDEDRFVSLIVASLDDDDHAGPALHVNIESKAPWYEIQDDLPQYSNVPPMPGRDGGGEGNTE